MIDIITNSYKVKYNILDTLYTWNYINKGDVSVYINLEPLMNKLAKTNVVNYIKSSQKTCVIEFISSIINLAAHYKWYFTKKGLKTKVFLHLQYPFRLSGLFNRVFIPDYKDKYEFRFDKNAENRLLSKLIEDSEPYIRQILDYIEGVHFVTTSKVESSLIPMILLDRDSHNVIVSDDIYDYQYNMYDVDIISPKGDESILIGRNWLIQENIQLESREYLYSLSPELLIFLISLVGSSRKSIPGIKGIGIKTVVKMINRALDEGLITKKTKSMELLVNLISDNYRQEFLNNYRCVNIDLQFYQTLDSEKYNIWGQIRDRFDNESLKKLNDDVFIEFPLNILELTRVPTSKKKPQIIF